MSYYYRKPRHRTSWYSRTNRDAPRASGPRKSFDVEQYLKQEFFNCDDLTFAKIANLYRHLYGPGPYRYLLNTFYSWKKGHVRVSGQTTDRILECVPKFLTDDKRFHILKCEIVHFVERLHFKQQNKKASIGQLNSLFENYAKEIDNFREVNLTWFVSKGIFDETEIEEFLAVSKYALRERLNLCCRQVQNDLSLVKYKFMGLKPGTFSATYRIDFLSSTIDLSKLDETSSIDIELATVRVNIAGKFKRFAEEYILEELVQMSFSEKEGEINRFIKAADLDFVLAQYDAIANQDGEASLKSTFKGEGGVLSLSLELKSLQRVYRRIFISLAKLGVYGGLLLGAVALVIVFHLYRVLILLIFGGWVVGAALLGGITTEIRTLRSLKGDLKTYGR